MTRAPWCHRVGLGLLISLLAVCARVQPAAADCLLPPLELLWTYPADGEQDVPLDATFWALASQGSQTPSVSATLNGQPLSGLAAKSDLRLGQSAFQIWPLTADMARTLAPDTAYTLRLLYVADSGAQTAFVV